MNPDLKSRGLSEQFGEGYAMCALNTAEDLLYEARDFGPESEYFKTSVQNALDLLHDAAVYLRRDKDGRKNLEKDLIDSLPDTSEYEKSEKDCMWERE